jgi:hypothetical protein
MLSEGDINHKRCGWNCCSGARVNVLPVWPSSDVTTRHHHLRYLSVHIAAMPKHEILVRENRLLHCTSMLLLYYYCPYAAAAVFEKFLLLEVGNISSSEIDQTLKSIMC